jgi:Arc/MetJ-type ribon-helix-helix transcriptional regulator
MEYNTVRIPRAIVQKIEEEAVKNGIYRNVSEFVIEATRTHLRELTK